MVDAKRRARSKDSEVVTNDAKRQRVSRACDQCRVARERCDGIQPICFSCASSNRDCTYTTNPKRRGIQPGSEEAVVGMLQNSKGQALITSAGNSASNKLHKKWRNNVLNKVIDRLLARETIDDLLDRPVSGSDDEGSDDEDEDTTQQALVPRPSILTPESLKASFNTLPRIEETFGNQQVQDIPFLTPRYSVDHIHQAPRTYQLPPNHWRLIEVYFSYTHAWLPISSKEHILKLCYSYPAEGLQIQDTPGSGGHAELWAILASAAVQNAAVEEESRSSVPNILKTAESLVHSPVLYDYETGHVSALLNLSLLNIATQKFAMAWLTLGRAIRAGLLLHTKIENESGGLEASLDKLKAVLRGCFVIETLFSAHMQIAPSLRTDYATTLGLCLEEGLDEWQPWIGCEGFQPNMQVKRSNQPSQTKSTFNHLIRLCYILNDSLVDKILGRFTPQIPTLLPEWLSTLPPTFGNPHTLTSEPRSPHKLQLFIIYLVERAQGADKRTIVQEIANSFDQFIHNFGVAAMPPLFACLLKVLVDRFQGDGAIQNRLKPILSQFAAVWRSPNLIVAVPSFEKPQLPVASPRTALPPEQHNHSVALGKGIAIPQSPASHPGFHSQSPMQLQQLTPNTIDINNATQQAVYDPNGNNNFLAPYNSTGSLDLDALFDDFTSFDATDGALQHPQFMQNLGYGPGANFADLMRDDLGWNLPPG